MSKWRKRDSRSFKRGKALKDLKPPRVTVLIVCEGSRTEVNYFNALKQDLRLTNVTVEPSTTGTDPLSVVDFAIEKAKDAAKNDKKYDRIYCVFDRDKHDDSRFNDAINKIRARSSKGFNGVISVPCFEVWILLHYRYTHMPFEAAAEASNCALVCRELRNHISDYRKGSADIYKLIKDKTGDAIKHAKQLDAFHETSETDNPSTKVHEPVEYLRSIRPSWEK